MTELLEINSAGRLGGFGQVNVGDSDATVEQALENSGLIEMLGSISAATTLIIQASGADTIDLDGDNEAGALNISNASANVNTDTLTLIIDGPLADPLGGTGTIQIGQRDTITFNQNFTMDGAALAMAGGNNTATLNGPGQITSITASSFTVTGAAVIDNDMTFSGTANTISVASAGSLTLNGAVAIPDAPALSLANGQLIVGGQTSITEVAEDFNWDGSGSATTTIKGTGILSLAVDQVDAGNDTFNGTINLNDDGDANVTVAAGSWTMAGTLNKNNAGTSALNGSAINITGNVSVSGGTLSLNTSTLSPGAALTVNGASSVLSLGANSILAGPNSITGTGTLRFASAATISANTTIGTTSFDWDGSGTNSLQTINDGVVFTINSTVFDVDGDMDDLISLGGTGAQLIVSGSPQWRMTRTLTANAAAAGTATIGGTSRLVLASTMNVDGNTSVTAPITFDAGANVSIDGTKTLTLGGTATYNGGSIAGAGTFVPAVSNTVTASSAITAANFNFDAGNWTISPGALLSVDSQIDFNSDAEVDLASGATLRCGGAVNFNTVNGAKNASFTGAGKLSFANTVNVNEAVAFNMVGGVVDLAVADLSGQFINIDAPLTINALTLVDFGNTNTSGASNTLDIDNNTGTGMLAVNLDTPGAPWTLKSQGVMNLTNDSVLATLLAGSPVNLNGTVNITGNVRTAARVNLGGTVNIQTTGQKLVLGGGDSNNPNQISGATINGAGGLGSDGAAGLIGFGTINAPLDFDGAAFIRAANGVLNLNGAISDVSQLEVVAGATLNLGTVFNTSVTDAGITLSGGTLQGALITNSVGRTVTGFGTVANSISNDGSLSAVGGNLTLTNANSDWDGASNDGTLTASGAVLELQDNSLLLFLGTMEALNGGTISLNGFDVSFSTSSLIRLDAGTLESTHNLEVNQDLEVGPTDTDSVLRVAPGKTLSFLGNADVALVRNLILESTDIHAVGNFVGPGTLIIAPTSHFIVEPGRSVSVSLENRGTFTVAGVDAVGLNFLNSFVQTETGVVVFHFSGTATNQFDSFSATTSALLAGTLAPRLLNGHDPDLGQSYEIIRNTAANISGTFQRILRPTGMPDSKKLEARYFSDRVFLRVVADTYWPWINSFPSLGPLGAAALDKAADPELDGLTNLAEFAIDGDPSSGKRSGKLVPKVGVVGGANVFTYTIPVRNGALPAAGDSAGGPLLLEQTTDGVTYAIEASTDLASWNLDVTEVTGGDATVIQGGLPALSAGWTYRTFRAPGSVTTINKSFMRVVLGGDYVNGSGL